MAIRDWPAAERPREKLLQRGPAALSDAELLAIFLRTGVAGRSALDLARELLVRFGGLRALLTAGQAEFCALPGLGPAKFAQLQAVLEMAGRHLGESLQRDTVFSDPAAVRDFLRSRLRDRPHEVFACLFLDNRHRLIEYRELFRGTIDGASVHPREVLLESLALGAASLILAHNHPSGVAEPSMADRHITARLRQALALVDIRLLDHFVIGDGDIVSFAERGLI